MSVPHADGDCACTRELNDVPRMNAVAAQTAKPAPTADWSQPRRNGSQNMFFPLADFDTTRRRMRLQPHRTLQVQCRARIGSAREDDGCDGVARSGRARALWLTDRRFRAEDHVVVPLDIAVHERVQKT